jgi:hypothetical protein
MEMMCLFWYVCAVCMCFGTCVWYVPAAFSNPFIKSLFSIYLLTGVATLLAQGTCPLFSDPIFDSASLMS